MNKLARGALGFAIASLVPAFGMAAISNGMFGSQLIGLFTGTLFFYPFSAAAAILFGIPVFFAFDRLRLVGWGSALSAGLIVGALVAIAIRAPHFPSLETAIGDLRVYCPLGAIASLVFWLIWSRGAKTSTAPDVAGDHA